MSSAVANCELADASTWSRPPRRPLPDMRNGGLPFSLRTSAPAAPNTSRSCPIGRRRRGSSPSRTTVPSVISASAARNRSVVPESPAFSVLPDATGRPAVPVTSVSPPMSSIPTPKPTSPEIITAVSSLLSNRLSTLLPFARAAITSALLVRLLDEGASRVPWTGPVGTSSSADRESQSGGAEPVTD